MKTKPIEEIIDINYNDLMYDVDKDRENLKKLEAKVIFERKKLALILNNKMSNLINQTPTGELRNQLTDITILISLL
jgi:hypothetical protein